MLARLEKRWKDCDQPVFFLGLILNLFEKLSCFGPNANLNQLKCRNLVILVYCRINARPDNPDTPEQRTAKENAVSKAFMQYLSRTGEFTDFDAADWEWIYEDTDPIRVWEALADTSKLTELAKFAIIILNIVANQAGCECMFSRTKVEQSDHRNRLGLEKMDKRTKIRAQIPSEHDKQGLVKPRQARKNHKSIGTLLSVPRYRDLLDDQEDEDPSERGRALVSSAQGWRTEVAKWIGEAKAAERAEALSDAEVPDDDEVSPRLPNRLPGWKPITLQALFGGAQKPRARKPSVRVMEEEEILMEALPDAAEDECPDDGAIERGKKVWRPSNALKLKAFALRKAFRVLKTGLKAFRAETGPNMGWELPGTPRPSQGLLWEPEMAPAEAKYHTSSRMGAPRKATRSNLADAEDAPRPSMGSIGREFMGGPWESAGTCLGDCEVLQGLCGRVLGVCRDLSGRLQGLPETLREGPGSLLGLGLGDIGRGFLRQWEAHGSLPSNVAETVGSTARPEKM
ncbi:hypothetical protein DFH09DRAFT_1100883 [Mycena vulgaris]|nr:hypothetical protein DFH09DRAFT_1100883 [Mycena vulgaris]